MSRRQEVLERIKATSELQDVLRVSFIWWRTPVVGIQDILLDEEPLRCRNDAHVGPMPLEASEEVRRHDEWKKNLIGGRKEWNGDCTKCYWHPPKDAKLFQLMRIEHDWGMRPSWVYYLLLLVDGRHFFIEKTGGPDCNLKVLEEENKALHLDDALRNVMFWKPRIAEEE